MSADGYPLGGRGTLSKSYAQKLTLENFIFRRAACLETRVYAVAGRLQTQCLEPYLQVSIYLYNACFATVCQARELVQDPWPYGGVKNGWVLAAHFIKPFDFRKIEKFDKPFKFLL